MVTQPYCRRLRGNEGEGEEEAEHGRHGPRHHFGLLELVHDARPGRQGRGQKRRDAQVRDQDCRLHPVLHERRLRPGLGQRLRRGSDRLRARLLSGAVQLARTPPRATSCYLSFALDSVNYDGSNLFIAIACYLNKFKFVTSQNLVAQSVALTCEKLRISVF